MNCFMRQANIFKCSPHSFTSDFNFSASFLNSPLTNSEPKVQQKRSRLFPLLRKNSLFWHSCFTSNTNQSNKTVKNIFSGNTSPPKSHPVPLSRPFSNPRSWILFYVREIFSLGLSIWSKIVLYYYIIYYKFEPHSKFEQNLF